MAEYTLINQWITKSFKFDLGITSKRLLQRFCQSDVSISDIAALLRKNQSYKHNLSSLCAKLMNPATNESEKEFKPSSHRIVALLGPIATRNLVVGSRIYRIKNGKLPDLSVNEEKQESTKFLKTALSLEDFIQSRNLMHPEVAFSCGIFIDLFDLIFENEAWYKEELKERPAILAKIKRAIVLANHFSQALSFPATSLIAAAMYTQMSRLFAHSKEKGFQFVSKNRTYQAGIEKKIYGYLPEDILALCLSHYQIFPEIFSAVRYYREPYQLIGEPPQASQLAAVLQIMDAYVEDWKPAKDEKDSRIHQWLNPTTNRIGLRPNSILKILEQSSKINI
ncbi:MAG: HDOD domain-containing protein [Oligoflexia bacterium]|nr:HDOD domain-containing protein [Oligoflexia bacterium]